MEKLIKLLNEYDKTNNYLNNWFRDEYGRLNREYGGATVTSSCWKAISKDYGFIKWLVENNKVDLKKANNINNGPLFDCYSDEDALIMALSIDDEPLKFLEYILK